MTLTSVASPPCLRTHNGTPGLIAGIAGFYNEGSRLTKIAVHRKPLELNAPRITSKENSLIETQGYPNEYPVLMEDIASGEINAENDRSPLPIWPIFKGIRGGR